MENTPSPVDQEPKKKQSYLLQGVAIAGGFVLGKIMGVGFLVLLPSIVIGFLVAYYLVAKKNQYEKKWVSILVWSNIVTWLIPLIGVFTSSFALVLAENISHKKSKYIIFGSIGLTLSIANAIFGIWLSGGTL